ncbi:MAG TPA: P-loop NTPase fold protein [Gaiellaceae bacterium]
MTTIVPPQAPTDWRDEFLAILQNPTKDPDGRPTPPRALRERGFVVSVPNLVSLDSFQRACLDQDRDDCATFRFRVEGPPVIGTLIAAFLRELEAVRTAGVLPTTGPVAFSDSDGRWAEAIQAGWLAEVSNDPRSPRNAPAGRTGEEWLERFLIELGEPRFVRPQMRVVLLCEVTEPTGESSSDVFAAASVLARLPRRAGIVISNLPLADNLTTPPHGIQIVVPTTGPAGDESQERTAFRISALRSDRPSVDDQLDVRRHANALASFLLLPQTTPLTVGIHGRWGKGKSSFMEMIGLALVEQAHATTDAENPASESTPFHQLAQAERDAASAETGRGRKRASRRARRLRAAIERRAFADVVTVRFNAWRYEDSTQIWAGLAAAVTERLEHALPRRARYWTPFAYALRRRKIELVAEIAVPVIAAILAGGLLAVAGTHAFLQWADDLSTNWFVQALAAVVPIVGGAALIFWAVAARISRALLPVSQRLLEYGRRPDYSDRMGYQHLVLGDLEFVHRRLQRAHPRTRVVIFIDDLDRCAPEKVMEILQAVNLILGESNFFVFLGIDTEMVERAIERHYDEAGFHDLPAEFASQYLHKIVQLNFHLPPATPEQRISFISQLFTEAARTGGAGDASTNGDVPPDSPVTGGLEWNLDALTPVYTVQRVEVEDTPQELAEFKALQAFVEDNPRELKRLVNTHRLVKILLQRDGVEESEERQRKLVTWLVFCARWRRLIDDVAAHAAACAECENCVGHVAVLLGREDLARFAGAGTQISKADLGDEGWLVQAAAISQLVQNEPAETPAVRSDPNRP